MSYKAIGYRVHVKPDTSETEKLANKAGLILAQHLDTKQAQLAVDSGVVLDIGPDAWAKEDGLPWCAVGDRIVYARHAGYRVGEGEDAILIINDVDVVTKEVV